MHSYHKQVLPVFLLSYCPHTFEWLCTPGWNWFKLVSIFLHHYYGYLFQFEVFCVQTANDEQNVFSFCFPRNYIYKKKNTRFTSPLKLKTKKKKYIYIDTHRAQCSGVKGFPSWILHGLSSSKTSKQSSWPVSQIAQATHLTYDCFSNANKPLRLKRSELLPW